MKEYLAAFVVVAIYIGFSLLFHRKFVSGKPIWLVILLIVVYGIVSKYYFDLINYIDNELAAMGIIYFNFGTANLNLLLVFLLCIVLGVANIAYALGKRYKNFKSSK